MLFLCTVTDLHQNARDQILFIKKTKKGKAQKFTSYDLIQLENKSSDLRSFISSLTIFFIHKKKEVNRNFFSCDLSSCRVKLCNELLASKIPVANMNCQASGFFKDGNDDDEWHETRAGFLFVDLKVQAKSCSAALRCRESI